MSNIFRRCLADLDVELARRVWREAFPHLPAMCSDDEVLAVLHYARTQAVSSPLAHRAYSHRWLTERALPSGLPDALRPKAGRMYPRSVGVVGIATKTRSPLANEVRGAMEYVVNDCYAEGDTDPKIIKPRMIEARKRVLKDA